MDVIGMTNLQEAKLAREAEICYTTIALVTDYDCWHPEHDNVTVDMIVANLHAERRGGTAAHRGGRGARAGGARMCVRQRPGDGHHHQPRRHLRRDQAGSGPDHRQVRRVRLAHGTLSWLSARSRSTPSRTRSARRRGWSEVRPRTSPLAASFFTDVRLVAVVGEDFAERGAARLRGPFHRSRRSADRAGRDVPLEGRVRVRPEPARDHLHEAERLRGVPAGHPRGVPLVPVRVSGQHPSPAATRGARPGDGASPGGGRHHELLDRGHAGRACARC